MICNSSWTMYIQRFEKNEEIPILTLKETESLFNRSIQDIYGCLLLDCTTDRSSDEHVTKEEFDNMINYHNGKMGYEYSNNEFRIVDYVEKKLSIQEQYLLGMIYVQYLNSRLTLLTDKKIYFYLFFDDNDIFQIRFYQQWNEEKNFIVPTIDDFSEPVAIYTNEDLCDYMTIVK